MPNSLRAGRASKRKRVKRLLSRRMGLSASRARWASSSSTSVERRESSLRMLNLSEA